MDATCKFSIVGIPYRPIEETEEFLLAIHNNEEVNLEFEYEPTNRYDRNAIKVFFKDKHIGYVGKMETIKVGNFLENATDECCDWDCRILSRILARNYGRVDSYMCEGVSCELSTNNGE